MHLTQPHNHIITFPLSVTSSTRGSGSTHALGAGTIFGQEHRRKPCAHEISVRKTKADNDTPYRQQRSEATVPGSFSLKNHLRAGSSKIARRRRRATAAATCRLEEDFLPTPSTTGHWFDVKVCFCVMIIGCPAHAQKFLPHSWSAVLCCIIFVAGFERLNNSALFSAGL